AITGVGFVGYGVALNREIVVEFLPRLATVIARLFVPAFPGELHPGAASSVAIALLAAIAAVAIFVATLTRRAPMWTALRQAFVLALAVVALTAFAPDLFLVS